MKPEELIADVERRSALGEYKEMKYESENPFHGAIAKRETQTAVGDAEQSRAMAEIQAAMVVAKKFPRDEIVARDKILNACTRPSLAESALYTYSRGGNEIAGPSIRLAEAMAQAWGNIEFGVRELEQRNGESTVQAFAWDMESNTRESKTFQVRHERYTKRGFSKLTDPRDIYEMTANQGARRLRACILGVIPGDIQEAAVQQCEVTLKTRAEVTPQALEKLTKLFGAFGISQEQIEKRIQRHLDAMQPAQLVSLRKIYNSLKDGMSKPEDWFELPLKKTVQKPDLSPPLESEETKNEPKGGDIEKSPDVAIVSGSGGENASGKPAKTLWELEDEIP